MNSLNSSHNILVHKQCDYAKVYFFTEFDSMIVEYKYLSKYEDFEFKT